MSPLLLPAAVALLAVGIITTHRAPAPPADDLARGARPRVALRATPADPSPASIDSIFARYDHTNTPGCAVGVYRDDRMVYGRGYGMADLNQGIPIGTSTVFYIASTSKQFAAASIALLDEEGTLSLRDPVRKWIPELPDYTQPITIAHLVHHTSGVRDYLGLWGLSGRSIADEVPQEVALDLIARQRALDFAPGTRYSYSNSGYLLLSEIVKRASGKSLRDFAHERIFAPLEMSSTQFHDHNARIVSRRAEGYQPSAAGGFEIVRTSFALVGDGGLLTTIEDLRRWDSNFYRNRLGKGDAAFPRRLTTPPGEPLAGGAPQRYAFGLMPGTYRGLDIVEHGGSFIGFRAQLLRFPSEHFSVAVLCNDYTAQPEQMARQVADRYLADRLAPASATAAATTGGPLPAATLERWTGRYEVLPGIVARIERDTSGLVMQVMGQRLPLAAVNDSTFRAALSPEPLRFARTAAGPTLVTDAFQMWAPALRLAGAPPLSAAALAAHAGRYSSDELDTWAVVRADGASLRARVRWGAWQTLEPMAPNLFTAAGVRVEFVRDRRGAVTGFSMSQVRMRNVAFTRVP